MVLHKSKKKGAKENEEHGYLVASVSRNKVEFKAFRMVELCLSGVSRDLSGAMSCTQYAVSCKDSLFMYSTAN